MLKKSWSMFSAAVNMLTNLASCVFMTVCVLSIVLRLAYCDRLYCRIKKKRLEVLKRYKNFSFHKIDIKNRQHLKKIFNSKKIKMVFHLAAQAGVRYSLVNPRSYIESNTLGFFNIIELIVMLF